MITPELEEYVQSLRVRLRTECEGYSFDAVMRLVDTRSRFYQPGTMSKAVYDFAGVLAAADLGVESHHQAIAARKDFEAKARAGWRVSNPVPPKLEAHAPITLDRAIAEVREFAVGAGKLVTPPDSLDHLLVLARLRSQQTSANREGRATYRLAARVVAEEMGLLTRRQQAWLRKSLASTSTSAPTGTDILSDPGVKP